MSQKTFVLDTNVLLQTPNALTSFGRANIVLPEVVLDEIDNFKKDKGEKGFCARTNIRFIDELRVKGDILKGVQIPNGGVFRVVLDDPNIENLIPQNWDKNKADNAILRVCKILQLNGEKVYLVSKDIIERVKANIVDILAEDFEDEQAPKLDEQYLGRRDVFVSKEAIDDFHKKNYLSEKYSIFDIDGKKIELTNIITNEYIVLSDGMKNSALAYFDGELIKKLYYSNFKPYGVIARNSGQTFVIDALMRSVEEAPLVIIKGPAGTAKTFLALACGLEKITTKTKSKNEIKEFRRILVCRPNVHMDEDIGYLPGTEKEKIAPLMRPIYDNLEILVDSDENERYESEKELSGKVQYFFDSGLIDTQSVAYLRGRSIMKHWLIIDEAQNLTPSQAKAIITRAGEGTKVILMGDPEQIDHPFLDARTNGLSYASEKMKGSNLCFQITFDKEECVRSSLAQEASDRL
jgi:PhoH-like ATPase